MHFAYDDQIGSQPEAVADALRRVEVPALDPGRPIVFTGIGTSLHACRVAAEWVAELSGGAIRPAAVQAHELALLGRLNPADQVVVVSHRGTKRFPNEVLARARAAGAATVLITGSGAKDPAAEHVLRTCADETASTHTVSYLTALAVLGKLISRLVGPAGDELRRALAEVPEALRRTLEFPVPIDVVARFAGRGACCLVTGFGLDAITAAEAALKIKEGAYLWAEGMPVEFAMHGPPAVFGRQTVGITISPAQDDGGRTEALRGMLAELGAGVVSCGDGEEDFLFAAVPALVRPLVAIVPLQRLVAELARARGTNPDTTRADEEPWGRAMGRVGL